MKDYFTLEYSPVQKCFHHDTINNMCRKNLKVFMKGNNRQEPGYTCLGVFETEEARQLASDRLMKLREEIS